MTTFDLLLVGHGHVARRFESLLDEQRRVLARDHGIRARIVGIKTRRSGPQPTVDFIRQTCARHEAAARDGRLVMVETTTLDIVNGEPAISHVRAALAGGAHVITANKGPAAFAYRRLARHAARVDRRFLFESAVMDGVPVFNLVRDTLPALQVLGFRGIVNTTTNYILTAMDHGAAFAEALGEMQALGIAEADASLDVEGWDAAAKTAALANVLLGADITPRQVERAGISPATSTAARQASAENRRLKLVARARRAGNSVSASVAPEALATDDLLAGIDGQQNALILTTDLLGEVAVVQRGSSLTHTAYGLLSDLIAVARRVTGGRAIRRLPRSARRDRSQSARDRR
jgi:homoserine dehydrogenase